MKSRRPLLVMAVIAAGLLFPAFAGDARGQNFVKFSESEGGDVSYYDRDRVQRSAAAARVWTKDVWGSRMKGVKKRGIPIRGYEALTYTISEVEVHCQDRLYRVLSYRDFDAEGHVLYESHPQSRWNRILPGSMSEDLMGFVCR